MSNYILRRIGLAIVTFFGITVLVFMISSMASGSPLELLLSNQNISPAEVERSGLSWDWTSLSIYSIFPG